jgi:hypothetical protein
VVSRFLRSQPRRIGLGHPLGRDPVRTIDSGHCQHLAQRKLERQMVLAVSPRDPALLAGFRDCQLSSPFGALGGIHDLVAQLVVANFVAHICQSLCNVCFFDFASRCRSSGRLLGRREPQSAGIELEQPRRLRSRIAKLETKLNSGELRSRPREQQITVNAERWSREYVSGDIVAAIYPA